jgi:hypothetical protein
MSLKLNSSGGGSVTLQEPTTASNVTLNLPAADGTIITTASTFAGTGPAFSAYASSTTTMSSTVWIKIGFQTEDFDTNNNFASSRFTPTVAGYYQINAGVAFGTGATAQQDAIAIYKNGSFYQIGPYNVDTGNIALRQAMSSIVYCNGSTDYIEIYALYNAGVASQNIGTGATNTWFNGFLARAA